MEAQTMTAPMTGTEHAEDPRNKFPQFGPLVRIWKLLDECDVKAAVAAGQPHEAARLMAGATRQRWEGCVALQFAADYGFEPIIGWTNIAGIIGQKEKTTRMGANRTKLPVYKPSGPQGRHPSVVAPLCQLVRWAELRLDWRRRDGW
jgi:hypothetical protein